MKLPIHAFGDRRGEIVEPGICGRAFDADLVEERVTREREEGWEGGGREQAQQH